MKNPYRTFAAMMGTAMTAMYGSTYLSSYRFDHVEWSETRLYMTLLMGSIMAVVMLTFMLGMYRNKAINVSIFAGSALIFAAALWLL